MDKTLLFVEGTIPLTFNGEAFYTYYKVVGNPPSSTSSSRPPVIAIHGGPGFSHDYILPISDIVVRDPSTTVIFYDLLGGARSTHLPHKPETFWTFELFVAELDNLVRHFGLQDKPFDLLGHCFGGALAMEYIVEHQPKALRRLVLVTSCADSPSQHAERKRLIGELPSGPREILLESMAKHVQEGAPFLKEEKVAWRLFSDINCCNVHPLPAELQYSAEQAEDDAGGSAPLNAMRNNVLEHNWDIKDRLHLIKVPTLLLNSERGYMTDAVVAPLFNSIEKVKWVKFAKSSHTPFWEERERFSKVLSGFLEQA